MIEHRPGSVFRDAWTKLECADGKTRELEGLREIPESRCVAEYVRGFRTSVERCR